MSAGEMAPSPSHTNRLINEKSPYLLQHAHNPVDWFPWGDEAFARAKQQDKPVFLSIGYATCHWCHVMAHESFEDEDVAALLNDAFVCVKVDREERPDIDGVYMTACQLTVGHGGWPLTVLLTPDKQPFFAGTFFPKATRPNLIGMLELVPRLKAVWDTRRQEVTESVDQIVAALTKATLLSGSQSLDETVLDQAFNELRARFDPINGGFGTRPKFPTPHQLTFLLRYWKRTKNDKALEMVETTLTRMRLGGLWDHVGFGFHRYSTDAQWLLPHFEKMLYDQAMLAIAYTETYQATGKYIYRQTAEEIFAYVLGEMTSPEGGFYCAEDADSEGEEGKFYVWSESELREVLSKKQAALTINVFCIEPEGNFFEEASGQKTGANILHLKQPLPEKAIELGLTNDDLTSQLDVIRQKLLKHRANRIRPLKDDKILADWNGLMIAALSKAARAFEQPRYAQAAKRAVEFVQQNMMDAGKLRHSVREGEVGPQCFLSDHAFFVWGLLELYETTFDFSLLNSALTLNERLIQEYWDDAGGAFYTTTHHAEMLPVRQKDFHDGATPSGNAVAMLNLLKLARFLGHHELEEMAHRLGTALSDHVRQSPAAFTQLLQAVDFALSPSREIVIASPSMPDASEMIHATRQGFWPNQIVVFISDSTRETITQLLPLLNEHKPLDQKPTAYVCQRFHCERPVTNAQALSKLLGDAGDHEKRPM